MKMCDHAAFCGKRMAEGDRVNGCNDADQARCNPVIGSSPTAPPAPVEPHPMWLRIHDGEIPR
jgi:hypothetical protein